MQESGLNAIDPLILERWPQFSFPSFFFCSTVSGRVIRPIRARFPMNLDPLFVEDTCQRKRSEPHNVSVDKFEHIIGHSENPFSYLVNRSGKPFMRPNLWQSMVRNPYWMSLPRWLKSTGHFLIFTISPRYIYTIPKKRENGFCWWEFPNFTAVGIRWTNILWFPRDETLWCEMFSILSWHEASCVFFTT